MDRARDASNDDVCDPAFRESLQEAVMPVSETVIL